jgi:hypothetical protein
MASTNTEEVLPYRSSGAIVPAELESRGMFFWAACFFISSWGYEDSRDSRQCISIVVWFRSSEAEQPKSCQVDVTNADAREVIRQLPDRAFPVVATPGDPTGK